MNRILPRLEVSLPRLDVADEDPLDATIGIVWGAMLGGTFWLTAIAIYISR